MSVHDSNATVVNGFTLVELLITVSIVMLITGALLLTVGPARQAFDRVPAELDVQQRARTALDAIAQPLRSALIVEVSDAGDTLTTITTLPQSGQGTLASAQADSSAPLMLSTAACPNIKDVCGFAVGMTAMLVDGQGGRDVFTVASVSAGARSLTANRPLSRAYGRNAIVNAVEYYAFSLAVQPDGSHSLVRQTYAGAVQPIVDFVSDLSFVRNSRTVDVSLRVHSTASSVPPRDYRLTLALRYPW